MNRVARAKQLYSHNSGAKSFIQRVHELTKWRGHPIDWVELLKETHAQDDQFISPAATEAHVIFGYVVCLHLYLHFIYTHF